MAFNPGNLVLWSATRVPAAPFLLPQWWGYLTSDNMATVSASGYFNVDPTLLIDFTSFRLNDLIYCACSDGAVQLQINALLPNITTISPNSDIAPGSITTSLLANGAVTGAKMAALPSGDILVGSAGNVATAVAMSGDVAIVASGATTIQPNAITTAKILNANVTLAKLSATVAPQSIIVFSSQYTTVGGAAAEAITVAGALATDLAYVQMVNQGPNTVSVVKAVMTANTLTVTFSGNPGAGAIINYQITRVAT